jgi:hypothetical protein
VIGVLISLLAAAPADVPGGYWLAECGFRKIDFKKADVRGPTRPLAMLFRTTREDRFVEQGNLRILDPSKLTHGLPPMGGFFTEDRKMLFITTDLERPVHFKLIFSDRPDKGNWAGAVGMEGAGSAAEHRANTYLGQCQIGQPADAVARYEALGAKR